MCCRYYALTIWREDNLVKARVLVAKREDRFRVVDVIQVYAGFRRTEEKAFALRVENKIWSGGYYATIEYLRLIRNSPDLRTAFGNDSEMVIVRTEPDRFDTSCFFR